ncbi:Kynurenine formamidase [Lentzea waywayandensis]|uniref:Kynurenine formamidase n=2 Tax=Lentzea TaxID=165301 RepID=A0A1I6F1Z9_9PSEU|nr:MULTISPECIES: cyclase family protein [Lentzea]SDK36613.1 Kynurenine formamidase [Lentzea albidocapillata subsp. violacea]SFR23964.1 Kynurenine formamidase [Lentzea waywayandensis]
MRIIDLSSHIDASAYEADPVTHEVLTAAQGAEHMAEQLKARLGIEFDVSVLRDSEFLTLDRISLTSHTGTHVDAPSHYGSKTTYGNGIPRHIDEMPLEWFHNPGVKLDVRGHGTGVIGVEVLEKEFARIGYTPKPMDIVILDTGAAEHAGTQTYFTDYTGLDGPATNFLLDLGVKVIATDAFSLDAPFPDIVKRYLTTKDESVLWPAHFAGRDREYCQIERLANLEALPDFGFTVVAFPVKIKGAGAGWTRAVALLDD